MSKPSKPVVYVAAGALYDAHTHSILMCQRANKGAHPNEWEFPGGKIEQGESPEIALVRELQEELNIEVAFNTITPAGFASYEYETSHVVILLYIVRAWSGDFVLNDHQSMTWVKVNELERFAALPADKPLLEALAHYI